MSEDQYYELFGQLVDEGFLDPGRAYRAGGAMPGSTSRIVGREENMTLLGDDVRLTGKGRAEIAQHELDAQRNQREQTLPPSVGPTQVGTMQGVVFRAVIQPNGAVELGVALQEREACQETEAFQ